MVVLAANSTVVLNFSSVNASGAMQPAAARTSYLALLLICIPTLTIFGEQD